MKVDLNVNNVFYRKLKYKNDKKTNMQVPMQSRINSKSEQIQEL